jgi:hypothetical protein
MPKRSSDSLSINTEFKGIGSEFYSATPQDMADANKAFANSLQQIKNIFDTDSTILSTALSNLETTKGLDLLNEMTQPIDDATLTYIRETYNLGSGTDGLYKVTDVVGTAAGAVHNDHLPGLTAIHAKMYKSGALNHLAAVATEMLALQNDERTVTTINSLDTSDVSYSWVLTGAMAGTYSSPDEAMEALIEDANTTCTSLATQYPEDAATSVASVNAMCTQIKNERTNMAAAGIVPADTQTGQTSSNIQLADNLHDYGTDDSDGGLAWIMEKMADRTTLVGQAITGTLREGRNIKRLTDAGIDVSMFLTAKSRVDERATLIDTTFTVDEAIDNRPDIDGSSLTDGSNNT